MSQQLAYVIVTPYSLYKSRTGGILSRLLTRTGLDLVGLRMFEPRAALVTDNGETIRDTYSDLIVDDNGNIRYFEPAVFAAPTAEEAENKLKMWARYSDQDGRIAENVISYAPGELPERTLVLIKPDNFRFPTGRPGNVIDFFSRAGLYIVGAKVLRMSTAQAMEFYGPVREILRTKLKDGVSAKAKDILEKEFGFKISAAEQKALGEILGPVQGDAQFDN